MLKIVGSGISAILAAALGLVMQSPGYPDPYGTAQCSDGIPRPGCDIVAGTSGRSGDSTDGTAARGGSGPCRNPSGEVIPCRRGDAWAGNDGCYYSPAELSADTVAALGGQPSGEGGWYDRTCYGNVSGGEQGLGGPLWMPGAPPVVSPEVLARQARARLTLPDVLVRLNPPGQQLVNLPVWLTLDRSSWKQQSATASVPGASVTATASPISATWSMGDGGTVECDGPGTAWKPGTDPAAASPDCGYTYRRSSAGAPGNKVTVTVTIAWEVTWAGAGESGTVPGLTTTGSIQVPVQESQAVIS